MGQKLTPQQLKRWEKTRAMGMVPFIIVYGVLGWGLCTGILFAVMTEFSAHGIDGILKFSAGFMNRLLGAIVIFPLGGVLFGYVGWKLAERNYRMAINQSSSSSRNVR